MVDFERVGLLLQIMRDGVSLGGQIQHIVNAAHKELMDIEAGLRPEGPPVPEVTQPEPALSAEGEPVNPPAAGDTRRVEHQVSQSQQANLESNVTSNDTAVEPVEAPRRRI